MLQLNCRAREAKPLISYNYEIEIQKEKRAFHMAEGKSDGCSKFKYHNVKER
jgi:hypothetical protein